MITQYKRFDFGDSATEFIKDCLSRGMSLSRQVLEKCPLSEGVSHTYLPTDVGVEAANKFAEGLWTNHEGLPLSKEIVEKQKWLPSHSRDIDAGLEIQRVLVEQKSGIFIVEDLMTSGESSKGKPKLEEYGTSLTNLFTYNKEIYFGICSDPEDATLRRVTETLLMPTGFYLVGVVSPMPEEFNMKSQLLTGKDIEFVARNAVMVIVGAYDEEGYIIWEKNTRK